MTRHTALHTPLLGDERVLDEESWQQNEAAKPTTETVDDDDKHDDDIGTSWGPSWIMSILFPLLIFIQFWMALEVEDDNDDARITTTTILSWPNVNMTIGIFAVSNWLYQRACQDSKIQSLILLLLPEIITILVLGLVMLETVAMAFLALNVGILLLSSLVLVETAHSLFCSNNHDNQNHDDNEEEEENKKFDILIV